MSSFAESTAVDQRNSRNLLRILDKNRAITLTLVSSFLTFLANPLIKPCLHSWMSQYRRTVTFYSTAEKSTCSINGLKIKTTFPVNIFMWEKQTFHTICVIRSCFIFWLIYLQLHCALKVAWAMPLSFLYYYFIISFIIMRCRWKEEGRRETLLAVQGEINVVMSTVTRLHPFLHLSPLWDTTLWNYEVLYVDSPCSYNKLFRVK